MSHLIPSCVYIFVCIYLLSIHAHTKTVGKRATRKRKKAAVPAPASERSTKKAKVENKNTAKRASKKVMKKGMKGDEEGGEGEENSSAETMISSGLAEGKEKENLPSRRSRKRRRGGKTSVGHQASKRKRVKKADAVITAHPTETNLIIFRFRKPANNAFSSSSRSNSNSNSSKSGNSSCNNSKKNKGAKRGQRSLGYLRSTASSRNKR